MSEDSPLAKSSRESAIEPDEIDCSDFSPDGFDSVIYCEQWDFVCSKLLKKTAFSQRILRADDFVFVGVNQRLSILWTESVLTPPTVSKMQSTFLRSFTTIVPLPFISICCSSNESTILCLHPDGRAATIERNVSGSTFHVANISFEEEAKRSASEAAEPEPSPSLSGSFLSDVVEITSPGSLAISDQGDHPIVSCTSALDYLTHAVDESAYVGFLAVIPERIEDLSSLGDAPPYRLCPSQRQYCHHPGDYIRSCLWPGQMSWLVLLVLSLLGSTTMALSSPLANCSQPLPQQQYDALFDLYNATDGPNWNYTGYFDGGMDYSRYGTVWQFPVSGTSNVSAVELAAPCSQHWHGITCSSLDSNMTNCVVTELDLRAYNLSGRIPSSLAQLSQLRFLDLAVSHLTGPVPSSLGRLSQLQDLYLDASSLSGPIPSSLGQLSQLRRLDLVFNSLSSSIPTSLGQLSELLELYLYANSLTGYIPSSLGQLSNLEGLSFTSNYLTGAIPSTLGQLSELQRLFLFTNYLSGPIPSSLGQLSHLVYMALNANSLNGIIPSSFAQLSNLQFLYLFSNSLTGPVPSSLGLMSQLRNLLLNFNSLDGTIPSSLGQMSQLRLLYLNSNALTGSIPSSLGQLSHLRELYLNTNCLSSGIPNSFDQLSQMSQLYLYLNRLTGTIPSSLGQLSQLLELGLNSNSLTGPIPSSLGQLPHFVYLRLDSNSLSGPIPTTLTLLSDLRYLNLSSNLLSGSIPASVGQLKTLAVLIIGDNLLTGFLPSSLNELRGCLRLYLNSNQLSGQLHTVFQSINAFPELELLDLSDNGFTGSFPSILFSLRSIHTLSSSSNCFHGSLGGLNVSAVSGLKTIHMDGLSSGAACQGLRLTALAKLLFTNPNPGYIPSSLMTGPLPSVLWSLPKLTSLSMNGNGFTGPLYSESIRISSANLTSVSLAYNRFTGSIPTALQLYGRFQYLDLSYNRLSGTLDSDFNFTVSDTSTLNISVNRLSGRIPTSSTNLLSTSSSDLISTVLRGNLFSFQVSEVALAIESTAVLYNGSYELDVATSFSCILIALFVGVATFLSLRTPPGLLPSSNSKVNQANSISQWWAASRRDERLSKCLHLSRMWGMFRIILARHLLMAGVAVVLGFVILPLKLSPVLQPQYSLYAVQYGWTWSVAYLKGAAPIVILFLFVTSLVAFHYRTFFPIGEKKVVEKSTLSRYFDIVRTKKIWRLTAVTLSASVLNASVLLVINGLYISSLNNAYIAVIQGALAMFKYLWTSGLLWLLRTFSTGSFGTNVDVLQSIRVLVLVFNYIVAPSLATAVKDASCFYELFNQPNALPGRNVIFTCINRYIFLDYGNVQFSCDGSANSTGIQSGLATQQLETSFDPPFIYNYQCGSALITNYVPVLLYTFLLAGLISPVVTLLALSYPETVRHNMPLSLRNTLFSPASGLNSDEISTLGISSSSSVEPTASGAEQLPVPATARIQICEPAVVTDHLALSTIVMMTFGLSTPYLAIVILCSATSQITAFQLLIGRYLHMAHTAAAAAAAEDSVGEVWYEEACGRVEDTLRGAWKAPYRIANIVLIVVILFWGLIIFDMIGNVTSYSVALTVMVAWMLCAPLLVYWTARVWLLYRDWQRQDKSSGLPAVNIPITLRGTELSLPFLPFDKFEEERM